MAALVAAIHAFAVRPQKRKRGWWEPRRVTLYRTIFPQMTNWLSDEEAGQLRFEFETEMARLELAARD